VKSIGLAVTLIALVPQASLADAVTDWNASAGRAARASCLSPGYDPFHESRAYAMAHIAIHDALNAIDRRSRPYAYDGSAPGASPAAAVAAAARDVLVAVIGAAPSFEGLPGCSATPQDGVAIIEAEYAAAVAAIPDGAAKADGLQVGRAAAAAILALRANDGSDTAFAVPDFETGTGPGEWRFTPGFDFALLPGWRYVTPFALHHAAQFRPGPPYKLTDHKYTRDFLEVLTYGGDGVITQSARSTVQTEIGLFWIESSPLAWNRIARTVSNGEGLDLWENARLFGLLNMALADGYIASFDTKYHYSFWRPVTAIHEADTDGNPDTVADPTWTPLQQTYPMPDYDSAHSVEGGAAAEVLREFFGTDAIAFTACSLSLPAGQTCDDPAPTPRRFATFSDAADENATSRVYIGIHFRDAVEVGLKHGRNIGRQAANLFMKRMY
jgi:hypothetical protein